MKRLIYLILVLLLHSCWTDVEDINRDKSLAGSVELFESYICSVSFNMDGVDYPVKENRIQIVKQAKGKVKVLLDGCFDSQDTYHISTVVDLTGAPGDVKIEGDFSLSLERNGVESFYGPAAVSGDIVNNTVLQTKAKPAVQDIDADINFVFGGVDNYNVRCYDVKGPYPDEL